MESNISERWMLCDEIVTIEILSLFSYTNIEILLWKKRSRVYENIEENLQFTCIFLGATFVGGHWDFVVACFISLMVTSIFNLFLFFTVTFHWLPLSIVSKLES